MTQRQYNPKKHHRRSIRLPGYDYTTPGAYYVTICAEKRRFIFGDIVDGVMHLNLAGQTVNAVWHRLPQHFKNVTLDAFVIMPNHLHGIIIINDNNWQRSPQKTYPTFTGTKPGSLSAIVQNFKSVSSRKVNGILKSSGTIWQSNFYEHIPRNQTAINRIRQYILDNPKNWENDEENPNYENQKNHHHQHHQQHHQHHHQHHHHHHHQQQHHQQHHQHHHQQHHKNM